MPGYRTQGRAPIKGKSRLHDASVKNDPASGGNPRMSGVDPYVENPPLPAYPISTGSEPHDLKPCERGSGR